MIFKNFEIYNESKNIPIKDWDFLYKKFFKIKNKILGKDFELSISILNSINAKKVNIKMRGKKYIPNTLSFKYSKKSGEIILTPEIILKENYENVLNLKDKILFLFIHSSLHLTDLDHGAKMDKLEAKYLKAFVV